MVFHRAQKHMKDVHIPRLIDCSIMARFSSTGLSNNRPSFPEEIPGENTACSAGGVAGTDEAGQAVATPTCWEPCLEFPLSLPRGALVVSFRTSSLGTQAYLLPVTLRSSDSAISK